MKRRGGDSHLTVRRRFTTASWRRALCRSWREDYGSLEALRQRRIEVSCSFTFQRRPIWTRISRAKEFRHRTIRTARRNDIDLMASELEAASYGVQLAMLDAFAIASHDGAIPCCGLCGVRHRDDEVGKTADAIAMSTLARHTLIARGFVPDQE